MPSCPSKNARYFFDICWKPLLLISGENTLDRSRLSTVSSLMVIALDEWMLMYSDKDNGKYLAANG